MRTVFFIVLSTFETVNKLTPPTLTTGQLYVYKHYSRHFCCFKKPTYEIKTKAHCKAKRSIFIRIEIQAGNPESRWLLISTFSCLLDSVLFTLAARAWSFPATWRHKDCSSNCSTRVLDLVSFIVHHWRGAFPLIFFFALIGWNVLLISCLF